ncbi:hypothetical protein HMPREF1589_00551 [Escherichia coli 113290]|nr:hypothetical protein HMPREF1589_00551 [Escherichia coli 113290]
MFRNRQRPDHFFITTPVSGLALLHLWVNFCYFFYGYVSGVDRLLLFFKLKDYKC